MNAVLARQARRVVGEAQNQQQEQPEQGRDQNRLGHFFMGVLHVHEDEHHNGSFACGNDQRNYSIERAEVNGGDPRGKKCGNDQDAPYEPVKPAGNDVLGVLIGTLGMFSEMISHDFSYFLRLVAAFLGPRAAVN